MEILGGPLFAVAGAGESHGPGYTTIVFGCPPGLRLTREDVQRQLDRRRPGGRAHGTARQEADQVVFLSGLYDPDAEALLAGPELRLTAAGGENRTATYAAGTTTGEPIAALVLSTSRRSRDYRQITGPKGEVRPGHTDLVKHYQSRGFADVRGGGRSSYRATISDVIGGSIARRFLAEHFGTAFLSAVIQVGPLRTAERLADRFGRSVDAEAVAAVSATLEAAAIPALDPDFAAGAADLIETARAEGDSLGAAVEVVAVNVPALVGDPLYQSLKLRLMGALGGLNAVRACEVGAGVDVVARRGSENNDPIRSTGYQSNHHGGMLGGITTGMPLVCRLSFKPTPSILKPQHSVRKDLTDVDFTLQKGRHDPCAGIRAGVTLESRMAIELLNAVLMHQTRHVNPNSCKLF